MHKILAMVAIAITGTLTTGATSAQAVVRHHLIDAATATSVASPFYLRAPAPNTLAFRAAELQRHYRVRLGDTLARISKRVYGTQADWPLIWAANGRHNPNLITTSDRLVIPARRAVSPRLLHAAYAAAVAASSGPTPLGPGRPAAAPAGPAAAPSHFSASGFEGCVMAAESGGVSTAWYPGHTDGSLPGYNNPVAEGLFGFLLSTWRGLGLGYSEGASYAPASVQIQGFWKLYREAGTSPWVSDGCAGGSTATVSATLISAHRHLHGWRRMRHRAMRFAVRQRGKPYEWGQTGPYGYDCSGLVYAAYHHAGRIGRRLGRDTYDMLAQAGVVLRRVTHPRRGDLAFFGTGHVELYAGHFRGHRWTFGALQSGTPVGRHMITPYWGPTAYYEVI